MGVITLVGEIVAKEGHTFLFTGGGPECLTCRLRKVCIDKLRKGHIYRITKVLGVKNRCPINGWVVTVEVEEVPVRAAIPKRYAVEGMIFRYVKPDGLTTGICSPELLPKETKVKVVKVYREVKCEGVHEPLMEADVLVKD